MKPLKLNILLSTFNDRIFQVKNVILEHRNDVSYIISHQYTENAYKQIPDELIREDIFISQIPGIGVTKSRNNALQLADGDIGLFSDDDVTYVDEYFDTIIRYFTVNKMLDIALFKIRTPDGFPEYKKYPEQPLKLSQLPFSVGTIEIAFNIDTVKKSSILFDERFGAGQPLLIGSDESIFVLDGINKGLNTWFYPEYVVIHPYESTIKLITVYDKRRVSVAGAFDARINGWLAIPKAFLGTVKMIPHLIRNKKNPFVYFFERISAAVYILFTKSNS